MGFSARNSEPGGVLLFQRLSGSTIGAAWFHGRVRDGIGWVTGAMAARANVQILAIMIVTPSATTKANWPSAVIDGGTLKSEKSN